VISPTLPHSGSQYFGGFSGGNEELTNFDRPEVLSQWPDYSYIYANIASVKT